MAIKTFFKSLTDILYPKRCIICQESLKIDSLDGLLCRQCGGKIKRNMPPNCFRCGRHFKDASPKEICASCQKRSYYFDRAFAPYIYEGVLKELIHQFKYSGKEYIKDTLIRLLIESITEYDSIFKSFDCVIPVPLHKRKMREREFNQSDILAKGLASQFNLVLLKDGLLRIRDTRTQTELPEEERFKNVKGCFLANPRVELKEKKIILVDDLLTTGATCSEAASALKNAGCSQVFVLTLAN